MTPDSVSEVGVQLDRTSLEDATDPDSVGDDPERTPAAVGELGLADELAGDTDSEQGKFKALLGILRKTISVKDLSSVRISLPVSRRAFLSGHASAGASSQAMRVALCR